MMFKIKWRELDNRGNYIARSRTVVGEDAVREYVHRLWRKGIYEQIVRRTVRV
jgi:hypothetical protein